MAYQGRKPVNTHSSINRKRRHKRRRRMYPPRNDLRQGSNGGSMTGGVDRVISPTNVPREMKFRERKPLTSRNKTVPSIGNNGMVRSSDPNRPTQTHREVPKKHHGRSLAPVNPMGYYPHCEHGCSAGCTQNHDCSCTCYG